jgi:hypothetical protein
MNAKERAEKFYHDLLIEEESEIRNGCIYLIAKVVHEGMEHQKSIDAGIAKHYSKEAADAINHQNTVPPKPTGLFNKLFFWKK